MSALLLIALGIATASLHVLLADVGWWFAAFGTMMLVFAASAAARYLLRRVWVGTLAGLVAGGLGLTLFFAGDVSFLGVIPTTGTWQRFQSLIGAANQSISVQSIPAVATPGILFLICVLIGLIALAIDGVAIWAESPAWSGPLLLVVVMVPSIVLPSTSDALFFALTAIAWLFIIRTRSRRVQPAIALTVGAVAVVGALIVPLLLPPVTPASANGTGPSLISANINPIINLGDDLRRGTPTLALSYTTTSANGEYLRLTTLDSFSGREWVPVATKPIPQNRVDKIGAAPGLTANVARTKVTTTVKVANTTGQWLPVPYPSTKISGLAGDWFWEPKALSVRSASANMQGQDYSVESLDVTPSQQQMEAAPRTTDSPLAVVPRGLDPIVAETAREVVGDAKTDFDKAVALQNWFTGGDFTYSEHTPAMFGFDGSGLDVIVPFLRSKSGYCVHFATTMAVMARTLGIPSRVAVGFLPGKPTTPTGSNQQVFSVSSTDLHAWPELYFAGVGWVRFEPTPSRGFQPSFPDAPSTSPSATPTDPSSAAPSAAPSSSATTTPNLPNEQLPTDNSASAASSTGPAVGWTSLGVLALLVVLAAPALFRIAGRRRRVGLVREGDDSATHGWDELRDSARDLGIDARTSETPRELAASLLGYLSAGGAPSPAVVQALDDLRRAVEDESFAGVGYVFIGDEMAENLQVVLRALRAATPLPLRLRALLLPPTLVDRAMGRTAEMA